MSGQLPEEKLQASPHGFRAHLKHQTAFNRKQRQKHLEGIKFGEGTVAWFRKSPPIKRVLKLHPTKLHRKNEQGKEQKIFLEKLALQRQAKVHRRRVSNDALLGGTCSLRGALRGSGGAMILPLGVGSWGVGIHVLSQLELSQGGASSSHTVGL